jgi:D-serine deaminase-like pyridoxal phosphate-dependent protein
MSPAIQPGASRDAVPTPALVIDLHALERNIAAMARCAAAWGVQLRPHVKSHRCVPLARRQIAAGAAGVSCATLEEAAAMVEGRITGILLTSPLAGDAKLARLAGLLERDPTITVVADDPAAVTELNALARQLSIRLAVLVDFDAGQRRTGCRSVAEAAGLAAGIRAAPCLDLAGVQAYAGHVQHVASREARAAALRTVQEQVRLLCSALQKEQLAPRMVTGAGTGSAEFDGPGGVYTELQAGSYLFMDAEYLDIEGPAERFAPALFVDATVVSARWEDHVTTDAGTKVFALNGPAPRSAAGEAGWTYAYDGDEFGRLNLAAGARRPARGERLSFIVPHCDPTVMLHSQYIGVRDGRVEECWPIIPRG